MGRDPGFPLVGGGGLFHPLKECPRSSPSDVPILGARGVSCGGWPSEGRLEQQGQVGRKKDKMLVVQAASVCFFVPDVDFVGKKE